MLEKIATVVIVPREQFSKAQSSLQSVFDCTASTVPIVYVDGNSPPHIRRNIEERSRERNVTVLRCARFLTSNEARNIGLQYVRTKYVAFIDNDVLLSEQWLERLVACAEETGAWAVGPLYLIGTERTQVVHTAGGDCRIIEQNGARSLYEHHRFVNKSPDAVQSLNREPVELVEFHCMLVQTQVFERIGLLDEGLLSFLDHDDFCLSVRSTGGSIYIEPAVTVTHLAPPPLAVCDVPFYLLRWSECWIRASAVHFSKKHGLHEADPGIAGHLRFRTMHRRLAIKSFRDAMLNVWGWRVVALCDDLADALLDGPVESTYVRFLERARTRQALSRYARATMTSEL